MRGNLGGTKRKSNGGMGGEVERDKDSEKRTARQGQRGKNSERRTARLGQRDKDSEVRTARQGQREMEIY
jgi:hypothetical protein